MSDLKRYPKTVRWSNEDEGWIATAPDLPGCSAFGETELDAFGELEFAISAWIEAAEAAGNPVPEPSMLDAEDYSGKFVLRLPKSLHAALSRGAKQEGVSLNQYVVMLLVSATAFHAVEAAARTASVVVESVRRTRQFAISKWHKQVERAGKVDDFAYVAPQNWSHLSEDHQRRAFEAFPYGAVNVIER